MGNTPWDDDSPRPRRKKKVVRKKRTKKTKAPAASFKFLPGPDDLPAWARAQLGKRGKKRPTHVVPGEKFEEIADSETFRYKDALYSTGLAVANHVSAAKLTPFSKWKGKTFVTTFASRVIPGHVTKVRGRNYVFAEFHSFVRKGSGLDK